MKVLVRPDGTGAVDWGPLSPVLEPVKVFEETALNVLLGLQDNRPELPEDGVWIKVHPADKPYFVYSRSDGRLSYQYQPSGKPSSWYGPGPPGEKYLARPQEVSEEGRASDKGKVPTGVQAFLIGAGLLLWQWVFGGPTPTASWSWTYEAVLWALGCCAGIVLGVIAVVQNEDRAFGAVGIVLSGFALVSLMAWVRLVEVFR